MKKFIYFIICFLLFSGCSKSMGQDDLLLKSEYKKAYIQYNDTLKKNKSIENYLNMCKVSYYLRDDDAAKNYCKEALNISDREKDGNKELRADLLMMMGDLYSVIYHNNDMSLEYYNQAKTFKESNPDTDKYNLAKLYRSIAFIYNHTGNVDLAHEYLDKALDILLSENKPKYNALLSVVYNDFALMERRTSNYSKSKEYLDKAIVAMENAGEYLRHDVFYAIYRNLSNYYKYNEKNKQKMISYSQKAADEISKNIEYKPYNEKSNEEKNKEVNIDDLEKRLEVYPYDIEANILCGIEYVDNDIDKAKEYFEKAINVNPKNPYIYQDIALLVSIKYINDDDRDYIRIIKENEKSAENTSGYLPDIYMGLGIANVNTHSIISANMYFNYYVKYSEDKALANAQIAEEIWCHTNGLKYMNYVIYYLNKALKLNPDIDTKYKLLLVSAYRQTDNNKKADEVLKKYVLKKSY